MWTSAHNVAQKGGGVHPIIQADAASRRRLTQVMYDMNERQRYVLGLCESAIAALQSSSNETFSDAMTTQLLNEVHQMSKALDPNDFSPTFVRTVIDSYAGHLADQLISLNYEYSRIRKNGQLNNGSSCA